MGRLPHDILSFRKLLSNSLIRTLSFSSQTHPERSHPLTIQFPSRCCANTGAVSDAQFVCAASAQAHYYSHSKVKWTQTILTYKSFARPNPRAKVSRSRLPPTSV